MEKLYSWEAKRAGGRITITHSCGKIVGVDLIAPERPHPSLPAIVVATCKDGRRFELVTL